VCRRSGSEDQGEGQAVVAPATGTSPCLAHGCPGPGQAGRPRFRTKGRKHKRQSRGPGVPFVLRGVPRC
jgi:hypothetical protein